jgi:crotonobetainyl-CoA:carnitine CoA-transferase CaiB-like acyl-CoA transferase
VIADTFASAPLAVWRERLATMQGVWAVVHHARELHEDPQVDANGYLPTVTADDGSAVALVASPVAFDETPATLSRAPEHGQHTEEVLLELGSPGTTSSPTRNRARFSRASRSRARAPGSSRARRGGRARAAVSASTAR